MGSAGERPARGGQVLRQQVRSRLDEPLLIERDAPLQPVRAGHGACHREHVPDALRLDLPALVVAPGHALEVTVPLAAHDLRMRGADDRWMVLAARAGSRCQSRISSAYGLRPQASRLAPVPIISWAPNFCAWLVARDASSRPPIPVGKPR